MKDFTWAGLRRYMGKAKMVNNLTQDATDFNNNYSDTQMGGVGLGQSNANIDLDANKNENIDNYNYEKEAKKQSEHEQNMYEWQRQLEELIQNREKIEAINSANANKYKKYLTEEQYNNLLNKHTENMNWTYNPQAAADEAKKIAIDSILEQMQPLREKINATKSDKTYDNRTELQRREDNAYERAVEDLRNSGLNPAIMSGGAAGSSGGGGGGKDDEEERKRRKKKELEEAKKQEAQRRREQQLMQMLGLMGGAGSMLTMQNMRNRGNVKAAGVQRTYTSMSQSTAEKKLRATLDEYFPV